MTAAERERLGEHVQRRLDEQRAHGVAVIGPQLEHDTGAQSSQQGGDAVAWSVVLEVPTPDGAVMTVSGVGPDPDAAAEAALARLSDLAPADPIQRPDQE